ncbi:MAG TPA: hypothetical protein PKK10_03565 [Woeseiaceae bacterium]|nr:hypothetical protein [Woeseiaceae bacterium]
MRPLTVINGILLGSCFSIALSLAVVLLVFLIIVGDYPRVQSEIRPLTRSMFIFVGMTTIFAWSFYTMAKEHRLRIPAQILSLCGLAATICYYWP